MADKQTKTGPELTSGPVMSYDPATATEAWNSRGGGSLKWELGTYVWRARGLHPALDGKYHRQDFEYVSGPGAVQGKYAGRTIGLFFHFGSQKNAANFYRGMLDNIAPWCSWPAFMPPAHPQTGKQHFWINWYGGAAGAGALIQADVVEEMNNKSEMQQIFSQQSMKLVEPSLFALGLLAALGIDWHITQQPAQLAAQNHLFMPGATQVLMMVQQGLSAIGRMPTAAPMPQAVTQMPAFAPQQRMQPSG